MSMVGKQLPMDALSASLTTYLIPWVSQIYLALAAFNLSRKPQTVFSPELKNKLVLFAACYLALLAESMLVAPNFGEAISFYPVMLWMLLLALFSTIYALFGINGMLLLIPLAAISTFLLDNSLFTPAQTWMQTHVHEDFEIDSHFNQFILSGCLGFVYGWFWHHGQRGKKYINHMVIMTSLYAFLAYLLGGELPMIDRYNIYAHEHDMNSSLINHLGVLGIEFLVLSTVLILHQKQISLKWKPLNWVGVYSLPIFLLHKIIFVHFWGPLLTIITAIANSQLTNSFWILVILTVTTLIFIYAIACSRTISLPFGKQCYKQWKMYYYNQYDS
ncbi:hypothetical protein N9V90_02855, partial [Endozoicomonas sp.]|nr:hypothetical protein [Endozoicomonas sp.]